MNRRCVVRDMGAAYRYRRGRSRCLFLATYSATSGRNAPSPAAVTVHFSDRKGWLPSGPFLTLRARPPQSRPEVGVPQGLALAAQLLATLSLLVVPALGLFLLSLALRRATWRDSCAPARKLQGRREIGR